MTLVIVIALYNATSLLFFALIFVNAKKLINKKKSTILTKMEKSRIQKKRFCFVYFVLPLLLFILTNF